MDKDDATKFDDQRLLFWTPIAEGEKLTTISYLLISIQFRRMFTYTDILTS